MSPYQIIAVMVRLFAVWLAIHLPGQLYAFYFEGTKMDQPYTGLITVGILLAALAIIVGLWFFPMSIARKLLRASAVEETSATTPDTWLAMGCALIGLYLLTESLPPLIRDSLVLFSSDTLPGDFSALKSSIIYLLFMVAVAIYLILGAKEFRKVFHWARYVGLNERPSNER
jgi:formate-dependent nitrite reductase membrane component NrfD